MSVSDEDDRISFNRMQLIPVSDFSKGKTGDVIQKYIIYDDDDYCPYEFLQILVYPSGINDKYKDYVSITANTLEFEQFQTVFHCIISILDTKNRVRYPQSFGYHYLNRQEEVEIHTNTVQDVGLNMYVSRSKLFEEAEELLMNDILRLQCELEFSVPKEIHDTMKHKRTRAQKFNLLYLKTDIKNMKDIFTYSQSDAKMKELERSCRRYISAFNSKFNCFRLQQSCSRYIAKEINIVTVVKIATLAYKHQDSGLKGKLAEFFQATDPFFTVPFEPYKNQVTLLKVSNDVLNLSSKVDSLFETAKKIFTGKSVIMIETMVDVYVLYDIAYQFQCFTWLKECNRLLRQNVRMENISFLKRFVSDSASEELLNYIHKFENENIKLVPNEQETETKTGKTLPRYKIEEKLPLIFPEDYLESNYKNRK